MYYGFPKKRLNEKKRFNTASLDKSVEVSPAMIADGLFERFPVDAVYAMHNMPGLDLGKLYFRAGEMMAAVDNWEIELTGKGSNYWVGLAEDYLR